MVADSRESRDSRSARRLNEPRPAFVVAEQGAPVEVGQVRVALVREEWKVVDRWWTERPIRRRYFDLVLETGRNVVVFRDEEEGGWFGQRA
jgi:hypothetical protein